MKNIVKVAKKVILGTRYAFRGAPLCLGGHLFRVDVSLRRWNLSSEEWMFQQMEEALKPGHMFVDVGANYGFHTLVGGRLVGPTGRVVSFEPIPGNLLLLRRNLELNRYTDHVVVSEAAVSDLKGETLEMGLGMPEADVTASLVPRADHVNKIHVANVALDQYQFPDGRTPAMIKIDVEGAELSVLRSARHLLSQYRPILLMEIHRQMLTSFGATVSELEDFLAGLGYQERGRHETSGSLDDCYHALFMSSEHQG